jgi:protein-tyrosine phosphatase
LSSLIRCVQAVVRLNAPLYAPAAFAPAGVAVADLFFEDCTPPPVDVVAKFLSLAEALPGALAVHCHAGLGRTGTLIALYMMKHHGFTAREAMGWLRIVRPGSVIGDQQQFLCDREALMRRSAAPLRRPAAPPVAPGDVAAAERLIAATVRAYDRSYAAAIAARRDSDDAPEAAAAAAAVRDTGAAADTAPPAEAEAAARLAAHVSEATNRRNGARARHESESGV